MKKKMMILAMLAGLGACLLVGACVQTPDLAQPTNLKIVDEVLTWDAVESAEGYVVDIDGEIYETETNRLDIFLLTAKPKTFEMKVFAYRDGENEADSAWSETIEYTVENNEGWGIKPTEDGEGYQFTVLDPTLMKGKFVMPSEIDGIPITEISAGGFYGCTELTAVILHDNLEIIGSRAFEYCSSLTRARLPSFLTEIKAATFDGCKNLKEVGLPNTLNAIGTAAFMDCVSLEKVDIPEWMERIDQNAFKNCDSLTEIDVSKNVQWIGQAAFSGCDNLTIRVAEENEYFKIDKNCLIRKRDNQLLCAFSTPEIPSYVKNIASSAFEELGNLKEIVIPKTVESIGAYTFSYCTSLEKVTFEEGLKKLGGALGAEQNCFLGCTSLTELTIPASVEIIASDIASNDCPNLKTLTVAEGNPLYKSEGNCIIRKSDNQLVAGCAGSVIPSYVKIIGRAAFFNLSVSEFTIFEGVERIESSAFSCSDVITIHFPESLREIGLGAFSDCAHLSNLDFSYGVEKVEKLAFAYCTSLESVVFPESLLSIAHNAFRGCQDSLKYCYLPEKCKVDYS